MPLEEEVAVASVEDSVVKEEGVDVDVVAEEAVEEVAVEVPKRARRSGSQ
jgi:hypothetical protein